MRAPELVTHTHDRKLVLPVATGPVWVERGAVGPAGRLPSAHARHEPGPLTVGLDFCSKAAPSSPPHDRPWPTLPPPIHGGVPGASGWLGRCAPVYMDDCHTPTLEQHLLGVAEVRAIFRRRQLYAKSAECESGRQELGFFVRDERYGTREAILGSGPALSSALSAHVRAAGARLLRPPPPEGDTEA